MDSKQSTFNMRVPHWGPEEFQEEDVDLNVIATSSLPDDIIAKPPLSDLERLYSE